MGPGNFDTWFKELLFDLFIMLMIFRSAFWTYGRRKDFIAGENCIEEFGEKFEGLIPVIIPVFSSLLYTILSNK